MVRLRGVVFVLLLVPAAAWAAVFWSVTDDQGRQNWVLGTMHSEDPRLLEWPEALMKALGEANRLALELVPDVEMLERMQQAMRFDDDRLQNVLGAELYRQVVEILTTKYGLTEPAVDRMKPWAVALTLATPPPETGMFMDLMLSFRARGAGLDVVALETIDEQIDFLSRIPLADQVSLIRRTAADHDRYHEVFESLIQAYLSGDLARLEAISARQMEGLDEHIIRHFNEVGIVERNQRMIERSEAWLAEGGLVIAVGALHLPGEHGLLALLRERGWKLEPIY